MQSIRDVGSILIAAIDLFNLVYLIINQFLKYSLGVLVWNHFILMIDEAKQSFVGCIVFGFLALNSFAVNLLSFCGLWGIS